MSFSSHPELADQHSVDGQAQKAVVFTDTYTKLKCGGAPKKICLLTEGNSLRSEASNGEVTTTKYPSPNSPMWTRRHRIPQAWFVDGWITVDNLANVLVSGGDGSGWTTVKYSPAGLPLWTNSSRLAGVGRVLDWGRNTFVAGTDGGYLTMAYSSTGGPVVEQAL